MDDSDIRELHSKVDAVALDMQAAKGMLKAALAIGGVAQGILFPVLIWLFTSVLTLREEHVATKIRLERVEYKCGELRSLSSTALPLQMASLSRLKDSSKNTRPVVSGRWDTTTLSSLLDCD